MDTEQRKAVVDALEGAFAKSGFADMYQVLAVLRGFLNRAAPFFEMAESRESLERYFASYSRTDEKELQLALPLLVAAPHLLRDVLQHAVQKIASELPGTSVGRPVTLTLTQRRVIVDLVSALHKKSGSWGSAQLRAAQQLGLSLRTVQRAWKQRNELPEPCPLTMADLWNVLGAKIQQ